MDRLSVDDLKRIELELMDELDRVCRAHGVEYFLGYGSLLGAVRHGGFIPWDDDMDVIMMRSEYERLMEGFDDWKSSDRFALASYRDGKSIYPFVKLVDTTTRVYENFVDKSIATGVWIDIFPLEFVDPSDLRAFRRNTRLGLVRSFIVADPSVGSNMLVKIAKRVVCPFASRLDPLDYARRLDENARDACARETETVADVLGTGDPSHLIPTSVFRPVEMRFEDRRYFAPEGYEEYLSIEYGDWRTPPPQDERPVHVFEAYRL